MISLVSYNKTEQNIMFKVFKMTKSLPSKLFTNGLSSIMRRQSERKPEKSEIKNTKDFSDS